MKKAVVCITAYDRLELFEQCLSNLSVNDHSLFDAWVFPDSVSEEVELEMSEICMRATRTGMRVLFHAAPETRLGCCRNVMRSLAVSFAHDGDYVIKLDSDILVTKDFVKVMLALSESIGGGMAVSSIKCEMSAEEKRENASKAVSISWSGSNFCISQDWWQKIEETAWPLVEKMRSTPDHLRDDKADWEKMVAIAKRCNPTQPGAIEARNYFLGNNFNTGSDAAIVLGAAVCDCPVASLVVNRAIHPSNSGENTTAEIHLSHYANTFLDEIEGDNTRTVFEY